mgnify:CR=1 FL=1
MPQEEASEVYGDAWSVNMTSFSVMITVGENKPGAGFIPRASIRIPLSNAKELALFLRSTIKEFEREKGMTVAVQQDLMKRWGIAEEDW